MLRLLLFRHAKSSWDQPDLADHERPLAKRGQRDAPRMADVLVENGFIPEIIICSTAKRTRETLQLILPALIEHDVPEIRFDPGLYEVSGGQLLKRVRDIAPGPATAMLIGHNPGLEDLAAMLTRTGEPEALRRIRAKFPTAALAVIDFEAGSWSTVQRQSGHLCTFTTPKSLA